MFVPLSLSKSTYCWLARLETEAASCAAILPVTAPAVRMIVSKISLFIVCLLLECVHNHEFYIDLAEFPTTFFGHFHMIFVVILCIIQCRYILFDIAVYSGGTQQRQLFILGNTR